MSAHLTLAVSREPALERERTAARLAALRAQGRCQHCGQVRPDARSCGIRDTGSDRWLVFYLCGPCIEDGRAEGYTVVA